MRHCVACGVWPRSTEPLLHVAHRCHSTRKKPCVQPRIAPNSACWSFRSGEICGGGIRSRRAPARCLLFVRVMTPARLSKTSIHSVIVGVQSWKLTTCTKPHSASATSSVKSGFTSFAERPRNDESHSTKKKSDNPRGPDVFRRIVAKLVAHIGVLRVVQPPAHQEVVESLLSEVTSCTSATKNVWSEGLASCLITSNTHRRVPQETSLADSLSSSSTIASSHHGVTLTGRIGLWVSSPRPLLVLFRDGAFAPPGL